MKEYKLKINGNDYNVAIDAVEDNTAKVSVNGVDYAVEFDKPISKPKQVVVKKAVAAAPAAASAAPAARVATASESSGETVVNSPLPGVILAVNAHVGDAVKKGQTVMLLEAMKMENSIEATCDGTIKKILAQKGDSVLEGADLFIIG